MFLNSEEFEIFDVEIEVLVSHSLRVSRMSAPRIMLEQQFLSLAQEIAGIPEPAKVKMKRMIPVYNQFDNSWCDRECSIEFMNHMYARSAEWAM